MTDPATTPVSAAHQQIDTSVPHSARIWNHWLGGTDNHPVDQQAGDAYTAVFPGIVTIARSSRAFLRRAVTHLVREAGIRQFLDVGAGLPTAENTHEVAQRLAPGSRIVYVDNDPMVLAHARALLDSSPEGATAYVDADVTDPDRILAAAAETLDPARPTGLILSNVLGHVADHGQARSIVARLMAALPPGSHLCVNDGSSGIDPVFERAQEVYNNSGAVPYHLRTVEEITSYFDGLHLVDPGVVPVTRWRPEPGSPAPVVVAEHGGIARKS
ncbi:S-adenosyl methyltransferase [Streptomyces sp. Ru62]|uniref:SAM-dependent methyltransferase n=1 Tax=Streptomyces sp. Ru62 TaxID=2080745 RepID=UPI000CDD74BB|nr:SAM-dependent methyltransferase [Streptomyces sp. Ru62]POX59027.1 S-adenosyl methyltransferase [Streptomyces sp. Ru62]